MPIRNTDTSKPRCCSVRATTKPSPPLLPLPQTMAMLAVGEIGIQGFDRGHDLAAGVFHQDQRGDADVLDGAAIGLAHLVRVQDAHCSEL